MANDMKGIICRLKVENAELLRREAESEADMASMTYNRNNWRKEFDKLGAVFGDVVDERDDAQHQVRKLEGQLIGARQNADNFKDSRDETRQHVDRLKVMLNDALDRLIAVTLERDGLGAERDETIQRYKNELSETNDAYGGCCHVLKAKVAERDTWKTKAEINALDSIFFKNDLKRARRQNEVLSERIVQLDRVIQKYEKTDETKDRLIDVLHDQLETANDELLDVKMREVIESGIADIEANPEDFDLEPPIEQQTPGFSMHDETKGRFDDAIKEVRELMEQDNPGMDIGDF